MNFEIEKVKNDLFENIFNQAKEGIAIVSLKGEWVKVNASVLNALGYTKEELYSMTFKEITHKDDLDIDLSKMKSLLSGTIPSYSMKKRYFHKDGRVIWTRLSVSLVKDNLDKPQYFISQISDISQMIKNENKLKSMLDIVKIQNERLSDFTEIITHNLKTHVFNLSTLVDFIEEDIPEIKPREDFKMLKDSVTNLNDTVLHLTEISKIKTIKENKLDNLNLCEYVSKTIYNVSALAKNIDCKIVNKVDANCEIKAISAYLDSIILNFLTNAIKYKSLDRNPIIELSTEIKNQYVVLTIKDNGVGIDLSKNGSKLFTLNGTFNNHHDSRGVGLFITKNHIESLGGKIEVESELNKGTSFSLYFLRA